MTNPLTPEELSDKSEDYACGVITEAEYRRYLAQFAAHAIEEYLSVAAMRLHIEEYSDE